MFSLPRFFSRRGDGCLTSWSAHGNRLLPPSRSCKGIACFPRTRRLGGPLRRARFAVLPLQYGVPEPGRACAAIRRVPVHGREPGKRPSNNKRECPNSRKSHRRRCPRTRLHSLGRGWFPQPARLQAGRLSRHLGRRRRAEPLNRTGRTAFPAGWSELSSSCACCCGCILAWRFVTCPGRDSCPYFSPSRAGSGIRIHFFLSFRRLLFMQPTEWYAAWSQVWAF
jgi:hypothetical protein